MSPDWQDRFAELLRQRTQLRLHYCSHQQWDRMREVCLGCSFTLESITRGRA